MLCGESEEAAAPQRVAPCGRNAAASGGAASSRCGADKLHRPTLLQTFLLQQSPIIFNVRSDKRRNRRKEK